MKTSTVAGLVQKASAAELLIIDAVQTTYGASNQANTVLTNIPYVNRLFKSTGIGVSAVEIPGQLILKRQQIQSAFLLTEEAFNELHQGTTTQIGIDFDVLDTPPSKLP